MRSPSQMCWEGSPSQMDGSWLVFFLFILCSYPPDWPCRRTPPTDDGVDGGGVGWSELLLQKYVVTPQNLRPLINDRRKWKVPHCVLAGCTREEASLRTLTGVDVGCWLAPRMECAKNSLRMLSDIACDVLPETEGLLLLLPLYLCIKWGVNWQLFRLFN